MQLHKNLPQEMPYSCTKQKLFEMYLSQMSENQIRLAINAIIEDNRKNMPHFSSRTAQTKNSKRIFPEELAEFVKLYSLPKGYVRS